VVKNWSRDPGIFEATQLASFADVEGPPVSPSQVWKQTQFLSPFCCRMGVSFSSGKTQCVGQHILLDVQGAVLALVVRPKIPISSGKTFPTLLLEVDGLRFFPPLLASVSCGFHIQHLGSIVYHLSFAVCGNG